jgi:hypothetical protein
MVLAMFRVVNPEFRQERLTEDCEIGIQVVIDNLMKNQLIGDSISERQISMSAVVPKSCTKFALFHPDSWLLPGIHEGKVAL